MRHCGWGLASWLCTRCHKRHTGSSSWEPVCPRVRVWECPTAVFQVCVGPPAGEAGPAAPAAGRAPGYTSVEKYSVFRFNSAKEMGGCCR